MGRWCIDIVYKILYKCIVYWFMKNFKQESAYTKEPNIFWCRATGRIDPTTATDYVA